MEQIPLSFQPFQGDVNEFLRQEVNLKATFHKLNGLQRSDILPLLVTGSASIWCASCPQLHAKSFDPLIKALVKQFYSESDGWLLRQQLLNRKQAEKESVAEFASEIRKLCQRLNVPNEKSVNYLIC